MARMQYHHIANAAVPSTGGRTLPVIDPSDGQPYDEIQRGTAEDIDAAVRGTVTTPRGARSHRPSGAGC